MPWSPDCGRWPGQGIWLVLLFANIAACGRDGQAPPVLLYAARHAGQMQAVVDAYSRDSGVTVLLVTESGRSIIDRLSAERRSSTADLVLLDGIGYLWTAAERDLLRPSGSPLLAGNVPRHLRDAEKLWFAVLTYGKPIVYGGRIAGRGGPRSYAALGDERFRGELCLSSAADADMQSLVAMMIAEHGDRPAELIVRGWIRNLAMPVLATATALLREIEGGRCGIGIAGSKVVARHLRENPQSRLTLFWPDADSGGAYIDIVGAAVTRHAGNPAGALRLLEWLTSARGQELIAGGGPGYKLAESLPSGAVSPVSLADAGYYLEDAVKLMERARWQE